MPSESRITAEQFRPWGDSFGRLSPDQERAAQHHALDALVDAFAAEMKAKLKNKADEGWYGWDDPRYRDNIERFMRAHVERGEGQRVDAANLLAMLWNLEQDSSGRA